MVVLISRGVSDRSQASNQSRALSILDARGVPYETVDGMDPSQRREREVLFGVSGVRGNYPQLFFVGGDGEAAYFGGYDRLEAVNEAGGLPR